MSKHRELPVGDGHFAYVFSYVDQTARENASGFIAGDVGLLCLQEDTNIMWMLTSTAPTWAEIGNTSSVNEIIAGTTAPGDTSKFWFDTSETPNSLKYYNGSGWELAGAELAESSTGSGGGGGSISAIDIRPHMMRLDDVAVGADASSIWDLISCIDFDGDIDGAVWFSFKYPSGWDSSKDINLTIEYSCDGNDQGKSVLLTTKAWAMDVGLKPVLASPSASNTDVIGTSSSNIDLLSETTLTNGRIPSASLTLNTNTIVVQLTRDADHASDTYTGTFELISIQAEEAD